MSIAISSKLLSATVATVIATLMAFATGPAYAQDSSAPQYREIEEVIVTAQKREQNLSDVPMSITALSSDELYLLGANDFSSYAVTVPGLGYSAVGTFGNRGQRQINLRGISSNVGAATVGYYVGESPIRFVDPRLFDINRIEVLRGPQGTLYGAGSMGGTIRIIPNAPNMETFEANAQGILSYTHNGEMNYSADTMLNLPLIEDQLVFRGVFFYESNGGYIDNKPPESLPLPPFMVSESADELVGNANNYNDETASGFRVALEYQPVSNVTITPSVFYQDLEGDAWSVFVEEMGDLTSNFLEMSPQNEEFTLYDLTIKAEFDWADLSSSTSYTDYELFVTEPFDRVLSGALGLPFPYVAPFRTADDRTVFVQEIRLTSNSEGKFTWLAGLFYQDQESTVKQRYVAPDINDDLFGGFPAIPGGNLFSFDSNGTEDQLAFFGEGNYAITEKLTATVGLRWFSIESDRYALADGVFNGGQTITEVSTDESGVTPKFQLSYKVTDDSLVYTTISEGFRPGFGYVMPPADLCGDDLAANGITNPDGQVDSDNLWAYEIGGNTTLANGAVFISGAAYINKWDNLQQSIELPTCGFTISENAGEAESKGFELEISATPAEGLNINFGLGYVDAELTQSAPGLGADEGDRLVYVPDWSASLGVTYARPVSDELEMFVHGNYSYSGDMNFNFDPSVPELYTRDSFSLFGGRVGLVSKHWTTSLFVENLFDERPTMGNLRFLTSGTLVYSLRPRTVGINVSYNY